MILINRSTPTVAMGTAIKKASCARRG